MTLVRNSGFKALGVVILTMRQAVRFCGSWKTARRRWRSDKKHNWIQTDIQIQPNVTQWSITARKCPFKRLHGPKALELEAVNDYNAIFYARNCTARALLQTDLIGRPSPDW